MNTLIFLLCIITCEAVIAVTAMEQIHNYKCESSHGSDIVIVPRNDIYGRVNEPLEVLCSIDPNLNISAADLLFAKWDSIGQGSETIQVLDNHTLQMNILENEPSKFNIVCTDSNNNWCVREVSIGYEPLDVLNFHCVSFNMMKLQCAYDLQENPAQMPNDEYYLTYYDGSENVIGHKCKSSDCCTLKGDECWEWGATMANYDKDSQFLKFILLSENRFEKKMFRYDINQYEQMIPDPVKDDYIIQPLGPYNMSVEFRIPYPLETFKPGIIYRIQYETSDIKEMILEMSNGRKSINTVIELDYPGQTYAVSISLRSGANSWNIGEEEDQWWSKAVTEIVQMPPVLPWMLPEITSGSFRTVDMGSKNLRNIVVFWKKIQKIFQGGPEFTYKVEVYSEGIRLAIQPSKLTASYAEFENMSANTQYEFYIIPKNIVGMAKSSVKILVEQNYILPTDAKFPLAIFFPKEQMYSLRWFSKENNDTQFTVFWCQEDQLYDFDRNRHCMGKLSWVILEQGARRVNLTKTELGIDNTTKNLRFAISTRTISANLNISGGLVWAQYPPGDYSPENSVIAPSLEVKDKTSSTAEIEWKILCQHWRGNPQKFEIFWCSGEHNLTSECFGLVNAHQELAESTFKIQNLRASQTYTVWVRIIYNGWFSEPSKAVHFVTAKPILLPKTIIWLSFGSVLVTSAALFFVVYFPKQLKAFIKRIRNVIDIPNRLDNPYLNPEESKFPSTGKVRKIPRSSIDDENEKPMPSIFHETPEDSSSESGFTYNGEDSESNAISIFDESYNENTDTTIREDGKPSASFIHIETVEDSSYMQLESPRKGLCNLRENLPNFAAPPHAYLRAVSAENIPFLSKHSQCNGTNYIPTTLFMSERFSQEKNNKMRHHPNDKQYNSYPLFLSENTTASSVEQMKHLTENEENISSISELLTVPMTNYMNVTCTDDHNNMAVKVKENSPYTDLGTMNAFVIGKVNDLHMPHRSFDNDQDLCISMKGVYSAKPNQKFKPVNEGYVQLVSANNTENDSSKAG